MTLISSLSEPHRSIYEQIFVPSPSKPLEWREVRALFREIADVKWQANGDLKVERNGYVLILQPPPSKDVSGADELLELRRFLQRSEEVPPLLAECEDQNPASERTPQIRELDEVRAEEPERISAAG